MILLTYSRQVIAGKGIVTEMRDKKVNVDRMHHPEKYQVISEEIPETFLSSKEVTEQEEATLDVWYVHSNQLHSYPKESYGIFYSENCYLVDFSWKIPSGVRRHVIYFWQGRDSPRDDKAASALLSKDMAHKYGRDCTQFRVPQQKEPLHFVTHFSTFLVRKGHILGKDKNKDREKKQIKQKKIEEEEEEEELAWELFQLRGDPEAVKSVQVSLSVDHLNSFDVFVVANSSEGKGYICGPSQVPSHLSSAASSLLGNH